VEYRGSGIFGHILPVFCHFKVDFFAYYLGKLDVLSQKRAKMAILDSTNNAKRY